MRHAGRRRQLQSSVEAVGGEVTPDNDDKSPLSFAGSASEVGDR